MWKNHVAATDVTHREPSSPLSSHQHWYRDAKTRAFSEAKHLLQNVFLKPAACEFEEEEMDADS